jgi:hypothetical protein
MSLRESLLLTIEAGSLAPTFSLLVAALRTAAAWKYNSRELRYMGGASMPEKQTLRRARQAKRKERLPPRKQGSSSGGRLSTFAAASTARVRQSGDCDWPIQSRREGVKLPPPARGKTSESTRKKAAANVKRTEAPKRKQSRKSAYGNL